MSSSSPGLLFKPAPAFLLLGKLKLLSDLWIEVVKSKWKLWTWQEDRRQEERWGQHHCRRELLQARPEVEVDKWQTQSNTITNTSRNTITQFNMTAMLNRHYGKGIKSSQTWSLVWTRAPSSLSKTGVDGLVDVVVVVGSRINAATRLLTCERRQE